jgi:hypothetical protein
LLPPLENDFRRPLEADNAGMVWTDSRPHPNGERGLGRNHRPTPPRAPGDPSIAQSIGRDQAGRASPMASPMASPRANPRANPRADIRGSLPRPTPAPASQRMQVATVLASSADPVVYNADGTIFVSPGKIPPA